MPTRRQIGNEISDLRSHAQDKIRRKYLKQLGKYTNRDLILYASAFASTKVPSIPSFFLSINNEDVQCFMAAVHGLKTDTLDLVLHSPGGSLEAADQIVQYLRRKFKHIRAIIPQNAMSAATMIACACDEIVMGKQSAIGPIDPQVSFPTQNGYFTSPAGAVLQDFEKAKEAVKSDPGSAAIWIEKVRSIPPGFLTICQSVIDQSKSKVEEWLTTYMDGVDAKKAEEISEWLSEHQEHKSHGRPIGIELAQEKGLNVHPLEGDDKLQDLVLSVHHAALLTLETTDCVKIIENQTGKGTFVILKPPKS